MLAMAKTIQAVLTSKKGSLYHSLSRLGNFKSVLPQALRGKGSFISFASSFAFLTTIMGDEPTNGRSDDSRSTILFSSNEASLELQFYLHAIVVPKHWGSS